MVAKVREAINGNSVYLWRLLVVILIGILGFYGNRLYAQIDRNSFTIQEIIMNQATKEDINDLKTDIRDLRTFLIQSHYQKGKNNE